MTEGLTSSQVSWKGWAWLVWSNCISLGLFSRRLPSLYKSYECRFYTTAPQSLVISAAGLQSPVLQYYFPLHLIIHNFHQSCRLIILHCWSIRRTQPLNHNHGASCSELYTKLKLLCMSVTNKGKEPRGTLLEKWQWRLLVQCSEVGIGQGKGWDVSFNQWSLHMPFSGCQINFTVFLGGISQPIF